MAILSIWQQRVQQWAEIKSSIYKQYCDGQSPRRNRGDSDKHTGNSRSWERKLHDNKSWRSVSVHSDLSRSWDDKPNRDPKGYRGYKRNRYHKYLYPVIGLLIAAPVNAENVGGISATANPIANSSGSVTNQAIQVLQGPYITNTYGDGISCQGPTLNVTPYVTRSYSWQFPFESHYDDPVYNVLDLEGDFDADGNPIGDGIPDKPGEILYHRRIRTGQKDNYNWNAGFSATISWPLDRKQQQLCKDAAQAHNELRGQILSNRRLEFELTRLTKCGEMAQKGISFATWSPYYRLCKDVVVQNKNAIAPHVHMIPKNQKVSTKAEDLGPPIEKKK